MEIQEIKDRLTLSQVLKYYNQKPDKQLRLNCPFHDDKTPDVINLGTLKPAIIIGKGNTLLKSIPITITP